MVSIFSFLITLLGCLEISCELVTMCSLADTFNLHTFLILLELLSAFYCTESLDSHSFIFQ